MSRLGVLLLLVAVAGGLAGGVAPSRTEAGPGGQIYWSASSAGQARIFHSTIDDPQAFTLFDTPAVAYDIALDIGQAKIYWVIESATATTSYIARTNFDGSGIQYVAFEAADHIRGVALDLIAGKVYWTARQSGAIRRANLDGSNGETVLSGLTSPESIAVDAGAGKVYWTQLTGSSSIWRSNLDGSGVQQLQTGYDATGLALNRVIGTMFWTHAGEVYGAPMTVNGFVNTPPHENLNVRDIAVDLFFNRLYLIDGSDIVQTTEKALPEVTLLSGLQNATALALDVPGVGGTATLSGVLGEHSSGGDFARIAVVIAAVALGLAATAWRMWIRSRRS